MNKGFLFPYNLWRKILEVMEDFRIFQSFEKLSFISCYSLTMIHAKIVRMETYRTNLRK